MSVLLYYISSHGFGHAARSVAILKDLAHDHRLIIRSMVPEWFFRLNLGDGFEYCPASFDCGCVQIDAAHIDWPATFRAYRELEAVHRDQLASEVAFIKSRGVDCVAVDIVPFGIEAARAAQAPAVAITNFTWADVYGHVLDRFPAEQALVERLQNQYGQADLLLRSPMGPPMDYFPTIHDVPVIARRGRNRRRELCDILGISPDRPLYLIYFGVWGLGMARWERLKGYPDATFLTTVAPDSHPENLVVLQSHQFPHEDLTASVDAVLAKPGYGICAECVRAGTPLVYCPREDFVEYPYMDQELRRWGGAVKVSEETLFSFDLDSALAQASTARAGQAPLPTNGARVCAEELRAFLK